MGEIRRVWVVENGIGHWLISLGDVSLHCDEGEINDAESELRQIIASS